MQVLLQSQWQGGVVLEATGITPKVLSYIQDGSATGIASAMSSVATVLFRGTVLPTDYYASVNDFTVTSTVAHDFSNNATISSTGGIRPYWQNNTFVIPGAPAANAIANFNQPLAPSKNFSISGSVTVRDGRIPAAGFYISDIPSSDIIKGTSNNYQLIHLKMKLEKNTEN